MMTTAKPAAQKGKLILFWITTGLLSFELFFGALWDFNLVQKDYVYGVLRHLGYPLYLAALLGICKILAATAILLPGFGVIKEWAYGGIIILFSCALYSHISIGDGPDRFGMAGLFLIITIFSWFLKNSRSTDQVQATN